MKIGVRSTISGHSEVRPIQAHDPVAVSDKARKQAKLPSSRMEA